MTITRRSVQTSIARISLGARQAALCGLGCVLLLGACGGDEDSGDAGGNDDPVADVLSDFGIDADADAFEGESEGNGFTGESDAGGGSIRAGNIVWPFSGPNCISEGSFLQVSGTGLRVDGTTFFGEIVVNGDEDYDDDGSPDPSGSVVLRFGTDNGQDPAADGEPDWEATLLVAGTLEVREFEYELVDGYVRGTGEITDFNGVETNIGEYVPLEFEGGCA